MKKMFNEGNQIHHFMSSSGSGTVINYGSGSGSDFLTSYGSGYGSGSTSQKVTVPTVPVPVPVPQHCKQSAYISIPQPQLFIYLAKKRSSKPTASEFYAAGTPFLAFYQILILRGIFCLRSPQTE
jgi:hypothetical protein